MAEFQRLYHKKLKTPSPHELRALDLAVHARFSNLQQQWHEQTARYFDAAAISPTAVQRSMEWQRTDLINTRHSLTLQPNKCQGERNTNAFPFTRKKGKHPGNALIRGRGAVELIRRKPTSTVRLCRIQRFNI